VKKGANALTARQALGIATWGGAQILGYSELGWLAPGNPADIAIFRIDSLPYAGIHDPIAGLIFAGNCHKADTVIVNGKLAVAGGKLVNIPEAMIMEHLERISRNLIAKAARKTGVDYMTAD
ncbi:amidohydrolase family protein, partial [bacterium]|nr:amidohydrolase family protein [candidate division CSSED10-310 bacterium]